MTRFRRKARVHKAIRDGNKKRPRLTVFRSGRHIYAQVIDDSHGRTLISASSLDKELRSELEGGANKDAAKIVGHKLAERSLGAGIKQVAFDRAGYKYHGRVKELAEGARAGGLDF